MSEIKFKHVGYGKKIAFRRGIELERYMAELAESFREQQEPGEIYSSLPPMDEWVVGVASDADLPKYCTCEMSVIMSKGCQCGGE